MNEIKSFTLYREIFRLIDTIKPIEKRDKFLGMIVDFYFKDKKPKLKPNSDEEIIWENIEKPINKIKTKCLNGSKGGRPKKTESETKDKTESETKNESESQTTSDVNVNVSNYDNNYVVNVNVNNLYDYIESNFGRTLNPIEYEEISKLEDNELTRYAVKEAVLNNAYSVKYILAILQNWKSKNIKTVVEAQKASAKRKNGNKPEWFDKTYGMAEASEEEKKEIEDLLKEFK